eukprot:CAMPEP_0117439774 /NCGR_PEP_ID=MMETSP0759-20121206/2736_1 /TAXON_ID=63605 /ORGANISM="Percolomonas cosmopolitus, Strain WS" /LENGTH=318 /DNA_ID=CAMNT_0005231495 /DNA_START=190 /DNA_END=1146 /DNA_ORIENTATION=+
MHVNANSFSCKTKRQHVRLSKLYSVIQQERRKSILHKKRRCHSHLQDEEWNLGQILHTDVIKVRNQAKKEEEFRILDDFVTEIISSDDHTPLTPDTEIQTAESNDLDDAHSWPGSASDVEERDAFRPSCYPSTKPKSLFRSSPLQSGGKTSSSTSSASSPPFRHPDMMVNEELEDEISPTEFCFDTSDQHESNFGSSFQFSSPVDQQQSIFVPMKEINSLLSAIMSGTASSEATNLFHEYCGKYMRPRVPHRSKSEDRFQIVPLRSTRQNRDLSYGMKHLLDLFRKMTTKDQPQATILDGRFSDMDVTFRDASTGRPF